MNTARIALRATPTTPTAASAASATSASSVGAFFGSLGAGEQAALRQVADHVRAKLRDPSAVDAFLRGAATVVVDPQGSPLSTALALLTPGGTRRMRAALADSLAPFVPPELIQHKGSIAAAFASGFVQGAATTPGDATARAIGGLVSGACAALRKMGEIMGRGARDDFASGTIQPQLPEVVSSTAPAPRGSPMLTMIKNRVGP